MNERKPFMLQDVIEGTILKFFRGEDETRRDFRAWFEEDTIDIDGAFNAYALTLALERAIDEALGDDAVLARASGERP